MHPVASTDSAEPVSSSCPIKLDGGGLDRRARATGPGIPPVPSRSHGKSAGRVKLFVPVGPSPAPTVISPDGRRLPDAVKRAELSPDTYAWIAGEASFARDARRHLVSQGVDKGNIAYRPTPNGSPNSKLIRRRRSGTRTRDSSVHQVHAVAFRASSRSSEWRLFARAHRLRY